MKQKKLFNNYDFDSIKNIIQMEMKTVIKHNNNIYKNSHFTLNNIEKDFNKRKKVEYLALYVDEIYNSQRSSNNAFEKIPIILMGSIYIDKLYEQVKDYSPEELALLSKYICSFDEKHYEFYPKFYTKEILSMICKKISFYNREDYLEILQESFLSDDKGKKAINNLQEYDSSKLNEICVLHGANQEKALKKEEEEEEKEEHESRRI